MTASASTQRVGHSLQTIVTRRDARPTPRNWGWTTTREIVRTFRLTKASLRRRGQWARARARARAAQLTVGQERTAAATTRAGGAGWAADGMPRPVEDDRELGIPGRQECL